MVRLTATEARNRFADLLNRVAYGRERIIVNRDGKDVVALVTVEDLALLEEIEDRIDVEEARKVLAESGPNVPLEQVLAEMGL
ncbi:MAG TPA: type II toxin-antitoxin system Phd/YefM family antitoxin [Gemmatimonadota bacterium]|nr:type II toxin-antitoxin system Phd/YefM family antitoxin [Gemmatimonadota bacterium]